ncbi:major facilitator superfamily domain-containing protein 1-like [Liolophura sinensis]|uniref:major facilitator superfamily domain-containing protein 1-like n=1 Tax=Liolophura sinensis TaxID=3198878 RepID=UPI0031592D21
MSPPREPRNEVYFISDNYSLSNYNDRQVGKGRRTRVRKATMDPSSCSFRFIVLFFNCILTFGPYFCYDMPTVLQNELQGIPNKTCESHEIVPTPGECCEDCTGLSPAQYNLLFAVFSWVNAVTVLFTGFLTDKLGNRAAVLLYSSVTLFGTSLFAVTTINSLRSTSAMFPLMLIGRMMLGSGNGGMRIVQDRVTAFWFKDKELAMAFGIMLSFSRLGSVLNFFVTTYLYDRFGMAWTFGAGAGLCGFGFLSAIILSALDRHGIRQLGQEEQIALQSKEVRVAHIRDFPGLFWLLVATITLFYSAVMPFVADSSKFLQDEYGLSKPVSAYTAGVVYDVALILSPVFGLTLDKYGRRGIVAVCCTGVLVPIYLTFLFTKLYPVILTVTLGLSYTLAAISMWPSVTKVVGAAYLGTAMGLTTCILDVGRGISNLIVGKLLGDVESLTEAVKHERWSHVLIFLSCNSGAAFFSSVILSICDRCKYDKLLDKPKPRDPDKYLPESWKEADPLLGESNPAIN